MDTLKVITQLLGVQDVEIRDFRLFPKSGRAEFDLRYEVGGSRCPECQWKLGRVHDWQSIELQGPPMGVFTHVVLRVSFPRSYCIYCRQNRSVQIPWRHPRCPSLSCGFAEVAGRMMEETTCEAAGRLLRILVRFGS